MEWKSRRAPGNAQGQAWAASGDQASALELCGLFLTALSVAKGEGR